MAKKYESHIDFMRRKDREAKEMSHKENDKVVDNILDTLSEEEYDKYTSMTQDELIEIIATHEDHHNEHHEIQEEIQEMLNKKAIRDLDNTLEQNKARQLLTFFKWGLNSERIENSMDGDFISSIDPPELEYGLYIEPRLAEKIRRLLKEEIDYAKSLY